MERFQRIAIPEGESPLTKHIDRFQRYSEQPIAVYQDNADSEAELARRIGEADCVLIGWGSRLSRETILACSRLSYIGLAATLFSGPGSNIDLETARERGIAVSGVSDYGDIGVVEFVLCEIIRHIKYGAENTELGSHCVGIVGAGATGSKVAHALHSLGADTRYFSRSRKPDLERLGVRSMPLAELLRNADVVSLHLPRNTHLLTEREMRVWTGHKLLINTSLGLPVERSAMVRWLQDPTNRFVADADGAVGIRDIAAHRDNAFLYEHYAGLTSEAQGRLIDKVEQNITQFLRDAASHPRPNRSS